MGLIPKTPECNFVWPVAKSYSKKLPQTGQPGSFWEDRKDRRHCGIDIYAPFNAIVAAVKSGTILDKGIFTDNSVVHYWNRTYYVTIKSSNGLIIKYCELGSVTVNKGTIVSAGDLIGRVGTVLNISRVGEKDPPYIQSLTKNRHVSMLHVEVFRQLPIHLDNYLGGNLFTNKRPSNLLNPFKLLDQFKTGKE